MLTSEIEKSNVPFENYKNVRLILLLAMIEKQAPDLSSYLNQKTRQSEWKWFSDVEQQAAQKNDFERRETNELPNLLPSVFPGRWNLNRT